MISIKDLETTEKMTETYPIGRVVRTAFNTKDRLCLKRIVVNAVDSESNKRDSFALIKSFGKLSQAAVSSLKIKIGMAVKATVQLIKDYGLILQVDGVTDEDDLTGFVANEQLASSKTYKVGAQLTCVVLDVDTDKKIIELSERLVSDKAADQEKKLKENQKAIIEMNNEKYLVVTLKSNRSRIGVCILQDFCSINQAALYARYSIGDEIDVRLISDESRKDGDFLLMTPKTS